MLKSAWNKVRDIIPEGVADYLDGGRYIKVDGTPYHLKGWKSYAHKPEAKAAMAMALCHSALEMAAQGTLNVFNLDVLTTGFMALACAGSAAVLMSYTFNSFFNRISKKDKAIDTQGRDLSRAQLNLSDIKAINTAKGVSILLMGGMLVTAATGAITGGNIESNMPFIGSPLHPYTTTVILSSLIIAERMQKLLTGEYCFCDKPPAKTVKSAKRRTVFGGATTMQPSQIPVRAHR